MNESHEKQAVQPFGPFFNLIFTIAMLVSRLLHPVSVEGLEHLPRRGALLIANHASNWDPILLATALPRDYRLRVMGKEELFRNPILAWIIRVGGAAVIGVRTGAVFVPVFLDGKKRLFHRTRILIGQPYTPVYTGRRGTAEEMQNIADELLRQVYALGGQQVGGAPL